MLIFKQSFYTLFAFLTLTLSALAQAEYLEVTLLGTGTPRPSIKRFGPATVITAGGKHFLFDSGRGISIRLKQANIPIQQIDHAFLTHLHSDHVNGFADFWLTSWIWQRKQPLHVYGPRGTKAFAKHMVTAHAQDIDFRTKNTGLKESAVQLEADEVSDGKVVYDQNGVRVIAFLVDHKVVKPAFGYRLEYGDRAVIISGDTTYSSNLIKYAKGADVLVHEIAASTRHLLDKNKKLQKIISYHTTPEQAAKVFNETKPRLAVYNHVLLLGIKDEAVMKRTREAYKGKVIMGHDLMRIEVDDEINVRRIPVGSSTETP